MSIAANRRTGAVVSAILSGIIMALLAPALPFLLAAERIIRLQERLDHWRRTGVRNARGQT